MVDIFTKQKRSAIMSAIKSKNTAPEMRIRRSLHSKGYRYKLHEPKLPGRPDIVLPRYKLAVQVRGCFWHGHSCKDGHIPKSRSIYWKAKMRGNKQRDIRNDRQIRRLGWKLIVIWECLCKTKSAVEIQTKRIERLIWKAKMNL